MEGINVIGLTDELENLGRLKFELLEKGLRLSHRAQECLRDKKGPIRTRSGASGGLDIVLPKNVHVNVPVVEAFASSSQLVLDLENGDFVIRKNQNIICSVELQPIPSYYSLYTSDGISMVKVGQMCSGDRFCYGMTGPYCFFWKRERRCHYCTIGLNSKSDASQKTIGNLLETLSYAVNDPLIPAKHVLVGGGTPDGDDMGALLAADICRAIKKRFEHLKCYVMISAPLKDKYIDVLFDSGADELGMNIELYSDESWETYIPGKNKFIGKKRYFDALDYSVKKFGPINTRSLIITGIEKAEYTIEGAKKLASMGVMPILSPFRPLTGSLLENHQGFSHEINWDIFVKVASEVAKYNIPVGPTCIPCQNNVLALPLANSHFHEY